MNGLKREKFISYGAYILSLLIFGTNGLYVSNISLSSRHIVLLHEAMTPLQMFGAVLIIGGAMFGEIKTRRKKARFRLSTKSKQNE